MKKYVEPEMVARARQMDLLTYLRLYEPEELVKIKAKTLVIAGTKDMIKKEHTRLIASHIPDSELVFLKGNHFIASKHPDEFNRAVLQFLRS
jgi:pimeloyl-ACP methyl ester carboxylesterase